MSIPCLLLAEILQLSCLKGCGRFAGSASPREGSDAQQPDADTASPPSAAPSAAAQPLNAQRHPNRIAYQSPEGYSPPEPPKPRVSLCFACC